MLLTVTMNAQVTMKIQSFTIAPGESKTILLEMDNPDFEAACFRCDLHLPEGITFDKNSRGTAYNLTFNKDADRTDATYHSLSSALQSDGALRIVCFPPSADVFLGNSGAIVNIPVTASSAIASGEYTLKIDNQEITNSTGVLVEKPVAYTATVTVDTSTGINGINAVSIKTDGKYISNNQLIIKKGSKIYNATSAQIK